jgi:hypothetical protein
MKNTLPHEMKICENQKDTFLRLPILRFEFWNWTIWFNDLVHQYVCILNSFNPFQRPKKNSLKIGVSPKPMIF